jgi:hypothetical protein
MTMAYGNSIQWMAMASAGSNDLWTLLPSIINQ